jgi:hypothetical protein
MSKPWHEKPLWERVYLANDRIYLHAGKIIGHLGIDPFGFYDAAKKLADYDKLRYENAVRDLTVYARREASPPRYELHAQAKKVLKIIIGPAPDDPEYRRWWVDRLVSVCKAREQGTEPEFAAEPPVPPEPASPVQEAGSRPRKPARKAAAKKPTRKKAG